MKRLASLMVGLLAACLLAVVALQPVEAAVVRGEGHYTYFGLAGDTKPVAAQAGDRFIETDTNGKQYIYSGSAWVYLPQDTTLGTNLKGENSFFDRMFGGPLGNCKHMTADGVVLGAAGMVISVYLFNATANDDLVLYDNATTNSGTKLLDALNVPAGFTPLPNYPASASAGIYLDLTTAGNLHVEICYLGAAP